MYEEYLSRPRSTLVQAGMETFQVFADGARFQLNNNTYVQSFAVNSEYCPLNRARDVV